MSESEPPVKLDVANNIATITLNRPENRNSMTPDVLGALAETIQKVRTDRDIRCVIVTGTGRSFCAGADFKSAGGAWDGEGDFQTRNERSYAMYQPFLSLLEVEVPVIAAMQGLPWSATFGSRRPIRNTESILSGSGCTRVWLRPGCCLG